MTVRSKPCIPGQGFSPAARAASRFARSSSRRVSCSWPEESSSARVWISGGLTMTATLVVGAGCVEGDGDLG
ncbi:hypothetical protein D9R06_03925 [Kocuria marina subsp. indica]|nr:hypothetical protein B1B07_04210 [Kocuria indica]RLP58555.1 hypothetical protein D9R06_03925 [Kocuria indica]